jgi:hypothetical protein
MHVRPVVGAGPEFYEGRAGDFAANELVHSRTRNSEQLTQ